MKKKLALIISLAVIIILSSFFFISGTIQPEISVLSEDVINKRIIAGCQQPISKFSLEIRDVTEEQRKKDIDIEKSFVKIFVLGKGERIEKIIYQPTERGYIVLPESFGSGMFSGLADGGNPNELMTCGVDYHIEFNTLIKKTYGESCRSNYECSTQYCEGVCKFPDSKEKRFVRYSEIKEETRMEERKSVYEVMKMIILMVVIAVMMSVFLVVII